MTRALALDLAPIRVNAVAPGLIDTPLWDTFGPQREAILARASKLPVGRAGRPEEIAEAVVFLMTNGFVTGVVLRSMVVEASFERNKGVGRSIANRFLGRRTAESNRQPDGGSS